MQARAQAKNKTLFERSEFVLLRAGAKFFKQIFTALNFLVLFVSRQKVQKHNHKR